MHNKRLKPPIWYPIKLFDIQNINEINTIKINNLQYLNSYQIADYQLNTPSWQQIQHAKQPVLYPLKEASTIIKIHIGSLTRIVKQKNIPVEKIAWKTHCSMYINQYEIQRLKNRNNPKLYAHLWTLTKMAHDLNVNKSTINQVIKQLKLTPVKSRIITGKQHYFKASQFKLVQQAIVKIRKQNRKHFKFEPNTNNFYKIDTDYNLTQLRKQLGISNQQSNVIYQWIEHGRVPYCVDNNYQIYFTKKQFDWICNHYQIKPNFEHISLKDAAQKLKTSTSNVLSIARRIDIKSFKILGLRNSYFVQSDFEKIKQRFEHPLRKGSHRN